jgi:SAM-dependent methyltransferase
MFPITQLRHENLTSRPLHFDIAFGDRDLEVECGFLEYLSRNLGRGRMDSFVEICCGTGFHLHWLAQHGRAAFGIDPSPEMVAFAEEKARQTAAQAGEAASRPADHQEPAGEGTGESIKRLGAIFLADPRDFSLPEAVDLAFCPNFSFRYLLRTEDVITHLVTVAKNLGRGGLYVIEADHPRILVGDAAQSVQTWDARRGDTLVRVRMAPGRHGLDPVTQVRDLSITLEIHEGGKIEVVEDSAPVRVFTHQELKVLVKLSGVFDWVATFGDLSITQPFDMSEGARAMVAVLRCSV